jgi:hypothetical protein
VTFYVLPSHRFLIILSSDFTSALREPVEDISMSDLPSNIQEFNTIIGLIFAQLYKALPLIEDIDRAGIAKAMGVACNDWSKHQLPSGRSFNDVLAHTIGWLNAEGYIRAYGDHPAQRVMLTTKGLAAMNAVPFGLQESLGTELRKAVETPNFDLSRIGDLIGGIFGGYTKSIGSG